MSAAELLADLTRLGIEVVAHEDRLRYRPRSALTPDLAERLRTHKAELLAILRPAVVPEGATTTPAAGQSEPAERRPGAVPIPAPSNAESPATPIKPVCRCGSTRWRDVPIHNGQSVRRDCGKCRRFIEFPVWYGKDTLQREQ